MSGPRRVIAWFATISLITVTLGFAAQPTPVRGATVAITSTTDCTQAALTTAITAALASQPATVRYDVSCTGATEVDFAGAILLTGALDIGAGNTLTIDANGNNVDFNGNGGRILAAFTGNLTLKGVDLFGASGDSGGAIRFESTGTLTVEETTFTSNTATGAGGAIVSSGPVIVRDSTFTSNSAAGASGGGAIQSAGSVTVEDSTFTSNSAPLGPGGAIYGLTTVAATRSKFTSNTNGSAGGALFSTGSATIIDSTFTTNTSRGGGALASPGTGNFISGSTFNGNSVGGGIFEVVGGALYLAGNGGALDVIVNSTFHANTSANYGGAIYTGNGSPLQSLFVTNSTFTSNSSPFGGAIGYSGVTTTALLQLRNNIFSSNSGDSTGQHDVRRAGGSFLATSNLFHSAIPTGATGAGNITGDPLLGVLQDNAGPTHTRAITNASPAYQTGLDATCTAATGASAYGAGSVDQRGLARDVTRCSIGAFEPNAEIEVVKLDGADPVLAGENLVYSITVANSGPDDAYGATLDDALPAGTTFVSLVSSASWTCVSQTVGSTDALDCTNAVYTQGESPSVFTLTVKVDPSHTADLSNTATLAATNAAGDDSTETTVVDEEADLGISKADDPDPVLAGNQLTYTITVTTAGPSDAQTVEVLDTLPAGTTFVSLVAPVGWTCTTPAVGSGGTVDCDIATLAADAASQVFEIVVLVSPAQTADLSNTATVTSTTTDPNTPNNGDAGTTVNEEADVRVTKVGSPDPVAQGANVTYTITVTNDGPSDAVDVALSDVMPAGTTFVSTDDPGCGVLTTPAVGGTGPITCTGLDLASGASVVWTIVLKAGAGLAHGTILTNAVSITGATTPEPAGADPANNTASAMTVVGDIVKPRLVYTAFAMSQVGAFDTFGPKQPAGAGDPGAFGAWRAHRMVVFVTCVDDQGLINSGVATNTYPAVIYYTRDGSFVVDPDGRCVDVAGNVADEPAVGNIMVDTQVPACSVVFSRKAKIGTPVSVTATIVASDATSGIATRMFTGLTPTTGVSPAVSLPSASPLTRVFTGAQGRTWTFTALVTDLAGNSRTCVGKLASVR